MFTPTRQVPAPENFTAEVRRLRPAAVVIVDCAHMDEAPGTLRLIDPREIGGVSFGTHGLPLSVLADYLSKRPAHGADPRHPARERGRRRSPVRAVREAVAEASSLLCDVLSP